jgi:hypothetical protein
MNVFVPTFFTQPLFSPAQSGNHWSLLVVALLGAVEGVEVQISSCAFVNTALLSSHSYDLSTREHLHSLAVLLFVRKGGRIVLVDVQRRQEVLYKGMNLPGASANVVSIDSQARLRSVTTEVEIDVESV